MADPRTPLGQLTDAQIAGWLRRYAEEHSGSHPANAGYIACHAAANAIERGEHRTEQPSNPLLRPLPPDEQKVIDELAVEDAKPENAHLTSDVSDLDTARDHIRRLLAWTYGGACSDCDMFRVAPSCIDFVHHKGCAHLEVINAAHAFLGESPDESHSFEDPKAEMRRLADERLRRCREQGLLPPEQPPANPKPSDQSVDSSRKLSTQVGPTLDEVLHGAGFERSDFPEQMADGQTDELAPLSARIAKGRAKYANGCTVLSLIDETGEVAHAVNKYEPADRIRDELLDVAAVAMRLYFGEIDRGLEMDGLVQRRAPHPQTTEKK